MKDKPIGKEKIEKNIKNVIDNILNLANEERKKSKGYKDLFNHDEVKGVIIDAEDKMMEIVLNTVTVLEEKYHIKIDNEKYDTILALPLISSLIERLITKEESSVCCVDKTHYILSKLFNL